MNFAYSSSVRVRLDNAQISIKRREMKTISEKVAALFWKASAVAILASAGTANAMPYSFVDPAFNIEFFATSASNGGGGSGLTFLTSGQLVRGSFSNPADLYVYSLIADQNINSTNTLHSAVAHTVTDSASGAAVNLGWGMTTGLDGYIYAAQADGQIRKIDPTTWTSQIVPGTSGAFYGLKTLPSGNLVYNAGSEVRVYDFGLAAQGTIYDTGTFNDDLAVAPTGEIIIAALGAGRTDIIKNDGHLGAAVLVNTSTTSHAADGMAAGVGGVFKNNTDGTITKLSFSGAGFTGIVTETIVASGGGYGDLAAVNDFDHSFYVTNDGLRYEDGTYDFGRSIARISLVDGGGFGNPVPEPVSSALLVIGLASFAAVRRSRPR
jgi:hypothetical protein